jgi:hypothetical protein
MALVALVTNWVRVLLLLVIGYTRGMNSMIVSQYHLELGYVLFVIVLIAFVWVATRRALPPLDTSISSVNARPGTSLGGYLAAVGALTVGPVLVLILVQQQGDHAKSVQLRLPAGHAEWHGPVAVAAEDWRPVFVGPHVEQHFAYQDAQGRRVEALAIGYTWQRQGQELINEGNSLFGDGGLSPLEVTLVRGGDNAYQEVLVVDKAGHRSVIWSVYDIGGRSFVIPLFSQLWYGLRSLRAPPYSALFAFRADCRLSCTDARITLERFVRGMGKELLALKSMDAVQPNLAPVSSRLTAGARL